MLFLCSRAKRDNGALISDYKGRFIVACNTKLDRVLNVLSADVQAFKQGLIFAQSFGFNRITITSVTWKKWT
jgi:hypothetical protein